MHLEEKMLSSENIYEGRIIKVTKDTVLLENGKSALREVVHHPGGVCIVPLCENGDIIMVRQFRYPFGEALLELPAGKLEYGESHYDCGLRELLEETGNVPGEYKYLGEIIPTGAYLTEKIHLYLAEKLEPKQQKLDDDEFLEVVRLPLEEAVDMVMSNKIRDGKSQIGILKTKLILSAERS